MFYSKVLERLVFLTSVFYVGAPAVLEFLSHRDETTLSDHKDVGLFMDLW